MFRTALLRLTPVLLTRRVSIKANMSTSKECMGCNESDTECNLISLPCEEHAICEDCLRQVVQLAVDDETHYPLTCGGAYCPAIPHAEVERVLSCGSADDTFLLDRFYAKVEEYNIPAANRMYCASEECCTTQGFSRFINPEILGEKDAVICPDCSSVTCRRCRDLVHTDQEHVCKEDDLDAVVLAFIETLPEDDRWLWRKCYSCQSWIYKSEACNHMTCRCKAEFCLVCGRGWQPHLTSCRHGCPHYDMPSYDAESYNQFGYHKDTGLDRDGNPWDAGLEHEQDYDDSDDGYFDDERTIYDEDGFDQWCYDRDGFDRDGYDEDGYDQDGFGKYERLCLGLFR